MRVTDDSDKVIVRYDPLIDTEIDIDAPYIDYSYVVDMSAVEEPTVGVYDTLFYNNTKILVVNEISEVEIRFYSTENPNENYRTGQKHFKGRILGLYQVDDSANAGFSIRVDTSEEWNGKEEVIKIDKTYATITKARCIAILYFNQTGRVINELVIPIKDWFSSKVYLNSGIVIDETADVVYKVGDIVDLEIYVKIDTDENGKIKVKNESITGKITELKLTQRIVEMEDEDGVKWDRTVYYYIITIDMSKQYNKKLIKIASNVIRSMVLHPIIPEV
jgi:hypothetical protein